MEKGIAVNSHSRATYRNVNVEGIMCNTKEYHEHHCSEGADTRELVLTARSTGPQRQHNEAILVEVMGLGQKPVGA